MSRARRMTRRWDAFSPWEAFVILRNSLKEMLGGGKMGLIRAILAGSSIVQEERDQAAAEGRAEGEAKGRAAEARRVLRLLLRKHFPELESDRKSVV